jgi:prepilin-type N-terminal cleavage/methylation domain-containing protein
MPSARNRSLARRGMTLVEVLVAVLLLAFGLSGVMDLYSVQLRHLSLTRNREQAQELAYGYLAQLQASGYNALDQTIRRQDPNATAGEAIVAKEAGPEGKPAKWNARLRREKFDGIDCIRIGVEVFAEAPTGAAAPSVSTPGAKKEVVGYVVPSATP